MLIKSSKFKQPQTKLKINKDKNLSVKYFPNLKKDLLLLNLIICLESRIQNSIQLALVRYFKITTFIGTLISIIIQDIGFLLRPISPREAE
jgi:hypothetical protein